MSNKLFQVVELQNDEQVLNGDVLAEPVVYTDYNQAFDFLNHRVAEGGGPELRQPKTYQPIRAELQNSAIELWIIGRADENFKS